DLDEDAYDHLRVRAETLLGAPIPPVRRRWAGVYSEVNPAVGGHALYHRPGRPRHDLFPGDSGGDVPLTRITVACLDMAGTTVADDGTVLEAFAAAVRDLPAPAFERAMTAVRSSMGQSKIEVFRRILGDEAAARKANEAFEDHYAAAVR